MAERLIDAVRLRQILSDERDECMQALDDDPFNISYWLGKAHSIEWAIDEIDSAVGVTQPLDAISLG